MAAAGPPSSHPLASGSPASPALIPGGERGPCPARRGFHGQHAGAGMGAWHRLTTRTIAGRSEGGSRDRASQPGPLPQRRDQREHRGGGEGSRGRGLRALGGSEALGGACGAWGFPKVRGSARPRGLCGWAGVLCPWGGPGQLAGDCGTAVPALSLSRCLQV